jgi:hypothetical protein
LRRFKRSPKKGAQRTKAAQRKKKYPENGLSITEMFMSSREDWVPREDWAIVVEESRRVWRLAVLMRRDFGPKTFIP